MFKKVPFIMKRHFFYVLPLRRNREALTPQSQRCYGEMAKALRFNLL